MILNADFVLQLRNCTSLKWFRCLKWILKNFSTTLHSQFNYHTYPVTPFHVCPHSSMRVLSGCPRWVFSILSSICVFNVHLRSVSYMCVLNVYPKCSASMHVLNVQRASSMYVLHVRFRYMSILIPFQRYNISK